VGLANAAVFLSLPILDAASGAAWGELASGVAAGQPAPLNFRQTAARLAPNGAALVYSATPRR
jgi:hypothetical protein